MTNQKPAASRLTTPSPVHVNRTLKTLEEERLIVRKRRFILIPEWQRLREISGCNELYLHLDRVTGAAA